ncbi:MAG: ribosome maturation factor RimP [Thermoleophilia bacterium]|nr:ribosome maturation factor RimP [Thermoleophilia bacterium]
MKLTETWVQEVVDDQLENVEIVDVEEAGSRRHRVVRIYVDHPGGVSHEVCARVSTAVGAALDEQGFADGPYTLEVSSPGLERPLKKPEHFRAQVGKKVSVKTFAPIDGQKVWRGILAEVGEDSLVVVDAGRRVVIRLSDIAKANLVFEFE